MTKYVLITGVSTGIGYDAAEYLISKGYAVIGSVRKKADKARLASLWKKNFHCLLFDVTDDDAIKAAFSEVTTLLNGTPLHALINNAGFALPGPMALLSKEELRKQIEVNVISVQNITNTFLPLIEKNNAPDPSKIINISSISGLFTSPFNGAYSVSKYGLEALSDAYRRELRLYDIQVSIIEPGPIKTKIWSKNKGALKRFENSDYGDMVSLADKVIENSEKNALPVRKVSELIHRILTSASPKARYLITKNKLAFRLISSILPTKMVDNLIWKKLSGKDAENYRGF